MVHRLALLTAFMGLLAVVRCQEGQVYCGRRLSTALALICENGLIKRSESHYAGDEGLPWIRPHHAKLLGRGKRNVVSECCDKPCTINELQAYCAN